MAKDETESIVVEGGMNGSYWEDEFAQLFLWPDLAEQAAPRPHHKPKSPGKSGKATAADAPHVPPLWGNLEEVAPVDKSYVRPKYRPLLDMLADEQQRLKRPVRTELLVYESGPSVRTLRSWLRQFEEKGVVGRLEGRPKSGWYRVMA